MNFNPPKVTISFRNNNLSCDKVCGIIQNLISKNLHNSNLCLLTIELKEATDDIALIPKIEYKT